MPPPLRRQVRETRILSLRNAPAAKPSVRKRPVASNQLGELIKTIAGAETAIQFAADRRWVLIEGNASICLTDKARQFAKELVQLLDALQLVGISTSMAAITRGLSPSQLLRMLRRRRK